MIIIIVKLNLVIVKINHQVKNYLILKYIFNEKFIFKSYKMLNILVYCKKNYHKHILNNNIELKLKFINKFNDIKIKL